MTEQTPRPRITFLQDSDLVRYIRAHKEPKEVSEELRRFYTEYQLEEDKTKYQE